MADERIDNLKANYLLGHYRIVSKIGAGGMSEVFLVEDTRLERKVALKVLPAEFAFDDERMRRFAIEAKTVSALNHPNILTIYEIGEVESINYIAAEYVAGETLREKIASLSAKETLDIAAQIAAALNAAHVAGIVHRDIKPENIMVRKDGLVKILDFGIAKLVEEKPQASDAEAATAIKQLLTSPGMIIGTPNYMSPEQARGQRVDHQTDVFSFGVVFYEMLSGASPFAGETVGDVIAAVLTKEPKRLMNVSPELAEIVQKTLQKDKRNRYQTMKGLLADLNSLRKRLEFENEFGQKESVEEKANEKTAVFASGKEASEPQPPRKSIAVLPFANMSADAENEYFCDGLAEELLNALSKIKELKVAARTSAFSFKNRNVAVSEIGKALNVITILEGSVRKSGNRLRISVQLIDAANGFHLWSKRYDGEMKDIFDLQDEITLAVINELKVSFLSEEKAAIRNRYAENVEAYELYLKGRYHFLKLTPAETEKGISYFNRAISLDPNYALAYAGLAAAYDTFPMTCDGEPSEFFPKAKAAARKAIEIDESLSEAYAALFWATFWYDWDWLAAEHYCQLAVELNPNDPDGHEAYAQLLSNLGRHEESLAEIRRARELDPLHLRINALEGQFLLHAGRPDEALARLHKTVELEPRFWLAHLFAASAYIEKKMFAEAVAEAQKARQFSGISTHPVAFGAYALAQSGKPDEARAMLEELLKLTAGQRYVPPCNIAMIYNALGERDKSLEWLERGFAGRDSRMTFLKVEPKWNNLRNEPRFATLMKRMNFPS